MMWIYGYAARTTTKFIDVNCIPIAKVAYLIDFVEI